MITPEYLVDIKLTIGMMNEFASTAGVIKQMGYLNNTVYRYCYSICAGILWMTVLHCGQVSSEAVAKGPTLDSGRVMIISANSVRELIVQFVDPTVQFEIKESVKDGVSIYAIRFVSPDPNTIVSSTYTIKVSHAGLLIDGVALEKYKEEFQKSNDAMARSEGMTLQEAQLRNEEWTQAEFPRIGSRAVVAYGMGPGGGMSSILFTTSDAMYDFEITAFCPSTNSKKQCLPSINKHSVASVISYSYDSMKIKSFIRELKHIFGQFSIALKGKLEKIELWRSEDI
jgi:hypothetical protein